MREIKFKAWDEDLKKMYSGDEIESEDNLDAWLSYGELAIYRIDNGEYTQLKPLQYTGLNDKMGNPIYEGDIVQISGHPFHGSIDMDGNYEVGYNEYMELSCGGWYLHRMRHWAEVIGNKFENPELLQGGTGE
jgi:uncharacterized phage protein (TIGR01671 family)